MSNSRREFLALSSFGLLGAAAALRGHARNPAALARRSAAGIGPEVSPSTFAEAETLTTVSAAAFHYGACVIFTWLTYACTVG
jgi:hypothetical protein